MSTRIRNAGARRIFQRNRSAPSQINMGNLALSFRCSRLERRLHWTCSRQSDASKLVYAGAYSGLVQPFAVHLLRFDLLAHRIYEFVVLPEARLFVGKL